jgi:PAS domain S-box-containing protein
MAGVCVDITERKQADEALRTSEEAMRLASEAGSMGTWEWDMRTNTLSGSERTGLIHGFTEPDFSGNLQAYLQLIHPDDRQHVADTMLGSMDNDSPDVEYRVRRPDGSEGWVLIKGQVFRDDAGQPEKMRGVVLDITERKRAEEGVRASEALFRTLADTAPTLVRMSGTDKLCTWFNRRWLEFTGRTMEQEVGNGWADGVHPEDFLRCLETYTTAFDAREPFEMEYRLRRHDGQYRWIIDRGVPLYGGDGQFTGYIGACIDIHDRIKAEQELADESAKISGILSAAADAIISIDEEGRIQSVNRAACAMFGYEEEEFLGQNITMLMAQSEAGEHGQYLRRYLDTGERKIIGIGREVIARRKDGSTIPADLSVSEITVDGRRVFTGILRDVSARRRRDEGQRFLLEAGAALAATLDYDATLERAVALAVPRLADLCVIDLVNAPGKLERAAVKHRDPEREKILEDINRLYPPRPDPSHPIVEAINAAETVFLPAVSDEMLRSIAQDDHHLEMMRQLPSHAAIMVPLVAHGRTMGALTFILDDPARVFDEYDVTVAEGFAQRVAFAVDNARLFKRSQEIQEELREANQAKDEFLGMISHELRTPITTILSGAHYLGKDGLDRFAQQEVVADIEQESERLQLIVENLLALGRAELAVIDPEPVSLVAVIKRVVESARRRRQDRKIEVDMAPGLPVASGVSLYTELVLRNLLDNAQKYSEHAVEVTAETCEDGIAVSVLDRGPGVPKEELEVVFERFYRSQHTAGRASGAGMGLSVCRQLVESQGGKIWASRREGGGLVVSFTLLVYDSGSPNQRVNGQAPGRATSVEA